MCCKVFVCILMRTSGSTFHWLRCSRDCNVVCYWSRSHKRNPMTQSEGAAHSTKTMAASMRNPEYIPVSTIFCLNSRSIPDLSVSAKIFQAFPKYQVVLRTLSQLFPLFFSSFQYQDNWMSMFNLTTHKTPCFPGRVETLKQLTCVSSDSSDIRLTSHLLQQTIRGLLENRGLILLNNSICKWEVTTSILIF